jgi:hypothetical protein
MNNSSNRDRCSFNFLSTVFLIGLVSVHAHWQLRSSDALLERPSPRAFTTAGSGDMALVSNVNLHFRDADFTIGGDAYDIASGDFNGDGLPDVVTANTQGVSSVSVLLNNGDGTFQAHVDYQVPGGLQAVAVGDFNGDGKLDVAVATTDRNVGILLGNGNGTFQAAVISPAGGSGYFTHSLAAGDF